MDQDKFCENIKLCEKAMYFLAYSLVRNEEDAADVVSDAILKAYASLEKLRNTNHFKTWILSIVHNCAVELLRKNKNVIDIEQVGDIEDKISNRDIETVITLKEAADKLKNPYREVVILFYYENLPTDNIAKIMKSNVFTVRQQLSRARKQLKQVLKEDFYNE